jgi:hypothetical protein
MRNVGTRKRSARVVRVAVHDGALCREAICNLD